MIDQNTLASLKGQDALENAGDQIQGSVARVLRDRDQKSRIRFRRLRNF